jgi:hypothetical protein
MDEPTKGQASPMEQPAKMPDSKPAESSGYGYGKKGGVWKWVIIYVIVAIVVYGAYFIYARNKSNSSSTGTTTNSIY